MAPPTRSSRFVRHPRLTIVAVLALPFLLSEVVLRAAYALWWDGFDADQAALLRRDGVEDVDTFWRELDVLYKGRMQYHPYRGYALPASFAGRYHATDRFGFRNPSKHRPGAARVAFFGGSTMYSVKTTAAASIPGLVDASLDATRAEAVNYGIGGYGSTNELMTFIEVTRPADHGIRWAVFLDGVNEVGRASERWQDRAGAPFYDVLGYRWRDTHFALANELGLATRPRLAVTRALGWLFERATLAWRSRSLSRTDEDYRQAGRAVAEIYFANLADIRALSAAKGIEPLFFLQPTVFDVARPTDRERRIREHASARVIDVGRLEAAAYRAIREDARFAAFGVRDLTDALEGRLGEIFFDDCHLTQAGNQLLARRIRAALPL
jgi:hypothetical protein